MDESPRKPDLRIACHQCSGTWFTAAIRHEDKAQVWQCKRCGAVTIIDLPAPTWHLTPYDIDFLSAMRIAID